MVVSRGKYRGLKIETLSGDQTRPTSTKVKEAIFSMLHSDVYGARVLDLFAGSGSLGIEALSCNAKFVEFYDVSNDAIKIIKNNLNKLKCDNYKLELGDYRKVLRNLTKNNKQYDIIFLDPPYHLHVITELVCFIYDNNLLAEHGVIVCESGEDEIVCENYYGIKKKEFSEEKTNKSNYQGLEKYKNKKYGSSIISLYRRV